MDRGDSTYVAICSDPLHKNLKLHCMYGVPHFHINNKNSARYMQNNNFLGSFLMGNSESVAWVVNVSFPGACALSEFM